MPTASEDVEKLGHSDIGGGNVKWTAAPENSLALPVKTKNRLTM